LPFFAELNTLREISLTQFRNYSLRSFQFQDTITCITGPNGSGKTALLDAVYYLCYTKSYFSAQQQHTVQTGTDGFRVEGVFDGGNCEKITCIWRGGKKEVLADGVAYERVSDHIGRHAAVMIAPDDMALINEGSEGRRRWVDSILGQTDREYLERLMVYQRVLLQRNAWLKMQVTNPSPTRMELEYYDGQLAETGGYIWAQRIAFFKEFMPLLDNFYRQLSGGVEDVGIAYESDLSKTTLGTLLIQSFEQDLRLQRTTKGVHRDELVFSIGGMPLRQYGSQGQKKSFLFAMKLAQYAYISMQLGSLPILLLDDVFEKLDQKRMEALLAIIQGPAFGQVLLTDTHSERVKGAFGEGVTIGEIQL
jgi:DNA replication and repair protein RecF